MSASGFSVKVAWDTSSIQEWFDTTNPLKLIVINSELANKFRKRFIKGFIKIGANNLYVGAVIGDLMFGVFGFSNPSYGNYDVLMKADTTPSEFNKSNDLLIFCLKSKEMQKILEVKFNREIKDIYTMAFSRNNVINRYRKHGKLIQKKEVKEKNNVVGYDLGYLFETGLFSLKESKAQFIQKSWKK